MINARAQAAPAAQIAAEHAAQIGVEAYLYWS